jgi:pimeloyl-ACP methyl ester carboxylesterase
MAARAARRGVAPAFVVLAAPHVATAREIVLGMTRRGERARGRSLEEANTEAAFLDATIGSVSIGARDLESAQRAIREHLRPLYEQRPDSVRQRQSLDDYMAGTLYGVLANVATSPMWRYFWALELSTDYAAITAPVLALFGERDGQVVADENIPLLRAAIPARSPGQLTISVVAESDHYHRAPRTPAGEFATGVIDTLASWLRQRGFVR